MAITTFPAILSQIGDGSIFVKISKGVYHLQIFKKIDPLQIWLKIAGNVVYAISSNSTNKIGYFWAHFGPQNSKNIQKQPPHPKKGGKT